MSLTSPLGLTRHLRRPDLRLELVPCLNVLLVAWMLTLLGSRFIYAPGIAVSLDGGGITLPNTLDLPQTSDTQASGRPTSAMLTVLSLQPTPLFILENGIHHMSDLQAALQNIRNNLPKNTSSAVLLIKSDGSLPLQTFLEVCNQAHAAGFATVQVATKPAEADNSTLNNPSPP
jgi:biopolymer transport protein ExbD